MAHWPPAVKVSLGNLSMAFPMPICPVAVMLFLLCCVPSLLLFSTLRLSNTVRVPQSVLAMLSRICFLFCDRVFPLACLFEFFASCTAFWVPIGRFRFAAVYHSCTLVCQGSLHCGRLHRSSLRLCRQLLLRPVFDDAAYPSTAHHASTTPSTRHTLHLFAAVELQ